MRLDRLEERDRALVSSWRADWNSAHEESRRVLSDAEREERKEALDRHRQRHVHAQLRRCGLRHADLPGVGWAVRVRLWVKGVHSAADVTEDRMRTIRNLDPLVVAAVVAWRVECDLAARRAAPRALDAGLDEALRARYSRAAARMETRHDIREARLDAIDAVIAEFWAIRRSGLNAAAARVRDAFDEADRHLLADLNEVIAERVAERVALRNIDAELAGTGSLSFAGYVWHVISSRASA